MRIKELSMAKCIKSVWDGRTAVQHGAEWKAGSLASVKFRDIITVELISPDLSLVISESDIDECLSDNCDFEEATVRVTLSNGFDMYLFLSGGYYSFITEWESYSH